MLRIGNHLHRDIRSDPEALIAKLTAGIAGAYAGKALDEMLAAAPALIAADGQDLMHF